MPRLLLTIAAIAHLAVSPAFADPWLAIYNKDEFDGKDRYYAITSATAPLLAFVCEAETTDIRLFYNSGAKMSRDLRKRLSEWPPWVPDQIAVIVDDQPARTYPGRLGEIDRKVVFNSKAAVMIDLGKIISAAQRRVLIAIDLDGQKTFRHEFPVAGSGPAISKLFETCAKLKAKRG